MISLWDQAGVGGCSKPDPSKLPPLTLAYIGDAVFELYVRTRLLAGERPRAGDLHREAVGLVRAEAQARALEAVRPALTTEEADLVRRTRNQKTGNAPRGRTGNGTAKRAEYALSSGFEALVGFLFLSGQSVRLAQILEIASPIGRPAPVPSAGEREDAKSHVES